MYLKFFENFEKSEIIDSEFFIRLNRLNYKIVWANQALVTEWVSPTRTNLAWILKRGYRSRSTYSFLETEFTPGLSNRIPRMIKGFGLIVLGLLKLLPALFTGKHRIANSLLLISYGIGTIAGLLGIGNYQMYQQSSFIVE